MTSSPSNVLREEFKGDFALRFDFDGSSRDPSRVFLILSDLIKALEATDKTLINSIDSRLKPVFLLEDIEEGSILIWVKTLLESVDDEGIKELNLAKIAGSYLVKAKYILIDFINKRTGIVTVGEVQELQAQLLEAANETKTNELMVYSPPLLGELLEDIGRIQAPLTRLESNEEIRYLTPSRSVAFNPTFQITPETIEDLATKERTRHTNTLILKIKSVDLLGQAQWEFRHNRSPIKARIIDEAWIKRFRERKVSIFPGDALRAEVQIDTRYDYNNEVISVQYTIIAVIEVLRAASTEQTEIEFETLEEPDLDD